MITYKCKLYARDPNGAVKDIYQLMVDETKPGVDVAGEGIEFNYLSITHEINNVSTCEGLLCLNFYKNDVRDDFINFASYLFNAMNSNFQRHVYITIWLEDDTASTNKDKKVTVFDGVLTYMKAEGQQYIDAKNVSPFMDFEAKGVSYLDQRIKRTFVPNSNNLRYIFTEREFFDVQKQDKVKYTQNPDYKFLFEKDDNADQKTVVLAYRPNMIVHNCSFFDYASNLAQFNGCDFFADDVKHTFSFISYGADNNNEVFNYFGLNQNIYDSLLLNVGGYGFSSDSIYKSFDFAREDYSIPCDAWSDHARDSQEQDDDSQDQDDGDDEKKEETFKDVDVVESRIDGKIDDKYDIFTDSVYFRYIPTYEFIEDENDKRLNIATPEGFEDIAKRISRQFEVRKCELHISLTPNIDSTTDEKFLNFICAPVPGQLFSFPIGNAEQKFIIHRVHHVFRNMTNQNAATPTVHVFAYSLDSGMFLKDQQQGAGGGAGNGNAKKVGVGSKNSLINIQNISQQMSALIQSKKGTGTGAFKNLFGSKFKLTLNKGNAQSGNQPGNQSGKSSIMGNFLGKKLTLTFNKGNNQLGSGQPGGGSNNNNNNNSINTINLNNSNNSNNNNNSNNSLDTDEIAKMLGVDSVEENVDDDN